MPYVRKLEKDILYYYLNYLAQEKYSHSFHSISLFFNQNLQVVIVLYFIFSKV